MSTIRKKGTVDQPAYKTKRLNQQGATDTSKKNQWGKLSKVQPQNGNNIDEQKQVTKPQDEIQQVANQPQGGSTRNQQTNLNIFQTNKKQKGTQKTQGQPTATAPKTQVPTKQKQ